MLKAIILIGGPQKGIFLIRSFENIFERIVLGTRFRPLSLDIPKPLFPVAGRPVIQHHIEACAAVEGLKEILLIGFYSVTQIQPFVNEIQHQYNVNIK